uniref:Uncharacterized protein n=1 Tax=Anguilla anguilla TaxID=7936 RepID=A0A0E9V587_ANGAN
MTRKLTTAMVIGGYFQATVWSFGHRSHK